MYTIDTTRNYAIVGGGTPLHVIACALAIMNRTLRGFGVIQEQTIAGAMGTAVMGYSKRTISAYVLGVDLILANGSQISVDIGACDDIDGDAHDGCNGDLLRAVRVHLGALGLITQVRLLVQIFAQLVMQKHQQTSSLNNLTQAHLVDWLVSSNTRDNHGTFSSSLDELSHVSYRAN